MIPDFKTYINETYWSRMNRRSQGTLNKKEDSIDLMDEKALYEHIHNSYEVIAKISRPQDTIRYLKSAVEDYFYIVVGCAIIYGEIMNLYFKYDYSLGRFISMEMDNGLENILGDQIYYDGKKYEFKHLAGGDCEIVPKDGDFISNRNVIELIDCILKCLDKPLIRKIK